MATSILGVGRGTDSGNLKGEGCLQPLASSPLLLALGNAELCFLLAHKKAISWATGEQSKGDVLSSPGNRCVCVGGGDAYIYPSILLSPALSSPSSAVQAQAPSRPLGPRLWTSSLPPPPPGDKGPVHPSTACSEVWKPNGRSPAAWLSGLLRALKRTA